MKRKQIIQKETKYMEGNEATSEAFKVLHDLLSALETLHSIDQRDVIMPEVAQQWKTAMDQGWQAHSAFSDMLEAWGETLEDLQYSADECAVDASQEPPQVL
jgi:hypothetical protein